ncbi:MAG: ATP-binding protein [Thermanaerothrix sp.]|nr:ATP-binding protein [Thermanaerothrix sp.]
MERDADKMKTANKPSLETVLKAIVTIAVVGVAGTLLALQIKTSLEMEIKRALDDARLAGEITRNLYFNETERVIQRLAPTLIPSSQGDIVLRSRDGGAIRLRLNRSEIMGKVVEENRIILVWGIIALLVSLELAIVLAYMITYPIRRLSWAMEAIARGDHQTEAPIKGTFIYELETLIRSFNRMALQLQEWQRLQSQISRMDRLVSMGEMVSGVAHEVRNPLAAMKIHVELLMEMQDRLPKEAVENLEFLAGELNRISDTVERFLIFARTHRGKMEHLPIGQVISWATHMMRSIATSGTIHLETRIENPNQLVEADPGKLRQVLLNLISNGVEAMPDGGRLVIWTQMEGERLIIGVDDTGEPIPCHMADRIFEPFVTTKPNGTGLGLAIAKKLVEEMGGHISFSVCNGVTSFKISLNTPNQGTSSNQEEAQLSWRTYG